jgi:chemotaxis protein methyltransferase CheR
METKKEQRHGTEWAEQIWGDGWTYVKTVVDTETEPFLVLDQDLCVLAANASYYKLFQVGIKDTEHKYVYELGNGEWNAPALQTLLLEILPKDAFFTGFEVDHEFPSIGRKVMLLNGRRIYRKGETGDIFPPIILLSMVDITAMTIVATQLADYAAKIEKKVNERTEKLETEVDQLKKALMK